MPVCYRRFPLSTPTGVIVNFAKVLAANSDIIEAQRIVAVWFTKCLIDSSSQESVMNESVFRYVANVADRDLVVYTLNRVWIPQSEPMI